VRQNAKIPHRVVVLDGGYSSYQQERELLTASGFQLEIFDGERDDRIGKLEFAQGAAGVFVRWTRVDEEFLQALPGVRALVRYGIGVDRIDLGACTNAGLPVCNVQGYGTDSVSDHALALLLASIRQLKPGMHALGQREFGVPPTAAIRDPHDMTLGLVGFGNIGKRMAEKCSGLFRTILAVDPYVDAGDMRKCEVKPVTFAELLRRSDALSLHCSLTPETRGLFNAGAFSQLKRKPVLINTARGEILEQAALRQALREDRLHSLGIDVFPQEPPGPDWEEVKKDPRCMCTGHYAWYSEGASRELQRRAGENMIRLLRRESPEDCLNPSACFLSSS